MIAPFALTVALCQPAPTAQIGQAAPTAPAAPADASAATGPTPSSAPSDAIAPSAPAERGVSFAAEPDGQDKRRKPKAEPVPPGSVGSPLVPPGIALPPFGPAAMLAFGAAGGLVPPTLPAALGAAGGAAPLAPTGAGAGAVAGAGAGAAAVVAKPTVRLHFTAGEPAEDTDIRLDGRRWAPQDWDSPRTVSSGRHRLSVSAAQGAHFEHIVEASAGEVVVEVPAVGKLKEGPVPLAVWLALGGTGVAVLTTTIVGFVALDKGETYHAANGDPGRTRSELETLRDDAQFWQTMTDVGLGLSVVGAGTTVALYFLLDREDTPMAAWTPLPGGGLLVLGGAL